MILENIADLVRIESVENDEMNESMVEQTHAVYPHASAFGISFTLEQYIDTPVSAAFDFLSQYDSIEQWSYGYRNAFQQSDTDGFEFEDKLHPEQNIHCYISSKSSAHVIDLHWSKADDKTILMNDSIRIVSAQNALNQPGCVLLWNCCQYPEDNKSSRLADMSVSTQWHNIPAQRKLEIQNIKQFLEKEKFGVIL